MAQISFQKHFLVAMPNMDDPRFNGVVVLLCEHNAQGALGLVINKQTQETFGLLCSRMGLECENDDMEDMAVLYGGPVHPERGVLLHQPLGMWTSTIEIDEQTGLSHSRDIFDAIREKKQELIPENVLLALGYTGWGAGQLEQEVFNNAWLAIPIKEDADALNFIFNLPPEERREYVLASIGISSAALVHEVGHG